MCVCVCVCDLALICIYGGVFLVSVGVCIFCLRMCVCVCVSVCVCVCVSVKFCLNVCVGGWVYIWEWFAYMLVFVGLCVFLTGIFLQIEKMHLSMPAVWLTVIHKAIHLPLFIMAMGNGFFWNDLLHSLCAYHALIDISTFTQSVNTSTTLKCLLD